MHRLGLRWISPRPVRPKTDPEVWEAFRKNVQSLVSKAVGSKVKGQIEIWFQVEVRMEQWDILRHIWAPRGSRTPVKRDCHYKSCVLDSVACLDYHLEATHLCEKSNGTEMNQHLAAISSAVKMGHHGVVVPERASWHRSRELKIPSNLTLLHPPPYSPELNPMKNVCNYLKSTFHAKRVFETLKEVMDNTQKAWKAYC